MKLLREYVNGFELPRLKEANIRGRERYVQSLHQLVLSFGHLLTSLGKSHAVPKRWNKRKKWTARTYQRLQTISSSIIFFSLVVSFSLTKISCWDDMEVPEESFHWSSWDSRTCYPRRAFIQGLTDDQENERRERARSYLCFVLLIHSPRLSLFYVKESLTSLSFDVYVLSMVIPGQTTSCSSSVFISFPLFIPFSLDSSDIWFFGH